MNPRLLRRFAVATLAVGPLGIAALVNPSGIAGAAPPEGGYTRSTSQGSGYSVDFTVDGATVTGFVAEIAYTCGGFPAYGTVGFASAPLNGNSFSFQSTQNFVTQTITGTISDGGAATGTLRLDYEDDGGLYCTSGDVTYSATLTDPAPTTTTSSSSTTSSTSSTSSTSTTTSSTSTTSTTTSTTLPGTSTTSSTTLPSTSTTTSTTMPGTSTTTSTLPSTSTTTSTTLPGTSTTTSTTMPSTSTTSTTTPDTSTTTSTTVAPNPPGPSVTLSSSTVVAGQTLTITGRGFTPGEAVSVNIVPDTSISASAFRSLRSPRPAIAVGDVIADSAGVVTTTWTVPVGTDPGRYVVVLAGAEATAETTFVVTTETLPARR